MKNIWFFDFETLTYEPTRVWHWGAVNIFNESTYTRGTHIVDFLMVLSNVKTAYAHNAGFDTSFIQDYILKNGWEFDKKLSKPMTFDTLISSTNTFYSMTMRWGRGDRTKIFCSYRKLPLAEKDLAGAFNMDIAKGKIDYSKKRNLNYVPDDEEESYLKTDVLIGARALRETLENGDVKMTIGSDAMAEFKRHFGRFRTVFPLLTDNIDSEIRKSYKGGWVYVNPLKKYPYVCKQGRAFDVNSLYPYVMRDRLLPYGYPVFFKGKYVKDTAHPLYVIRLSADFKLKEDMLPTIQIKKSRFFIDSEYISDSNGLTELTLTNVDYDLFIAHYDVFEINYICGYKFMGKRGFFDTFVDTLYKAKQTSEGGKKLLSKLKLNNLYGKFGKSSDFTQKNVTLDGDKVKLVNGDKEVGETVYIPLASFVTAYAREITITTAQKNIGRFIYADTDSNKYEGMDDIPGLDVDDKRLGAWKEEPNFTRGSFLRAKRYIVADDDGCHVTCAGMPDRVKDYVNFNNFKPDTVFTSSNDDYPNTHIVRLPKGGGKLQATRVCGGIILKEIDFTLK